MHRVSYYRVADLSDSHIGSPCWLATWLCTCTLDLGSAPIKIPICHPNESLPCLPAIPCSERKSPSDRMQGCRGEWPWAAGAHCKEGGARERCPCPWGASQGAGYGAVAAQRPVPPNRQATGLLCLVSILLAWLVKEDYGNDHRPQTCFPAAGIFCPLFLGQMQVNRTFFCSFAIPKSGGCSKSQLGKTFF